MHAQDHLHELQGTEATAKLSDGQLSLEKPVTFTKERQDIFVRAVQGLVQCLLLQGR